MWTAGSAGEPLSWAPLTADAIEGGDEGKSERESLIQSRKVPSALATLAVLCKHMHGLISAQEVRGHSAEVTRANFTCAILAAGTVAGSKFATQPSHRAYFTVGPRHMALPGLATQQASASTECKCYAHSRPWRTHLCRLVGGGGETGGPAGCGGRSATPALPPPLSRGLGGGLGSWYAAAADSISSRLARGNAGGADGGCSPFAAANACES